jgi:hypothetical protein
MTGAADLKFLARMPQPGAAQRCVAMDRELRKPGTGTR